MNTKIKIILVVVAVAIITLIFLVARDTSTNISNESKLPEEKPVDVVLDFYGTWLEMANSTSTNLFESELFNSNIFSDDARNELNSARVEFPDRDPITCQTNVVPEQLRSRIFPSSETEVKILVESQVDGQSLPTFAFVTTTVVDSAWQITDIECTQGDIAPDVEFNYNREGLLLKSVPPPYEVGKWHLVFEQDGQMGYVTPLFFSATTTCVSVEGIESICNPDTFDETASVVIKGGMTEVGAEVVRVEFLQ